VGESGLPPGVGGSTGGVLGGVGGGGGGGGHESRTTPILEKASLGGGVSDAGLVESPAQKME